MADQPMAPSLRKRIPQTAAYAMVHQIDPGKMLESARAALVEAKQTDAVNGLDRGLAMVTQQFGIDVRGLLDALGGQWATYSDAGVGGVSSDGIVIVNELDDPAKAEAGMKGLSDAILRFGGPRMGIAAADQNIGGVAVHAFVVPQAQVQPGWTIKDGALFVAFKPQAAAAATLVGNAATGGKSFSDNEKFNGIRKQLGGDAVHVTGFEFADLPQTAPQKHAELSQVVMVANMLMARWGVALPANLLPTLQVLQQHLAPAGSISWVDELGWHMRGTSPFPGSSMFSSQQAQLVAVGTGALTVSILLPSLNRARETANRVKCASNMRQIGQAILLYSNDNRGKYPDDAGTLIKTEDITIDVFTCPSGDVEPPADVLNGPVDIKVAWVNGSSPYTYVGKGLNNAAGADVLVLYERETDHDGDGMNMLFGDGHVEWNSMDAAKQIIAAKGRPK
jgi:prepilin-type processing-associated H-X9-DG protein